MGSEDSPQAYISRLVSLFAEIRRVLRDDGLLFVNIGDSYSTAGGSNANPDRQINTGQRSQVDNGAIPDHSRNGVNGVPLKSLIGIPQRFAIAMIDDGWILRSEIIWHKVNPMPSSAADRPTVAHEPVFMFAKRGHYWSDFEAVRTPVLETSIKRMGRAVSATHKNHDGAPGQTPHSMFRERANGAFDETYANGAGANMRDVLSLSSESFSGSHFATYPTALIRPFILAGCPLTTCAACGAGYERIVETSGGTIGHGSWVDHENDAERGRHQTGMNGRRLDSDNGDGTYRRTTLGFRPSCDCGSLETLPGVVYDPFMGAGTTALVARQLGRDYIGSELNPEYINIALDRLRLPFAEKASKPSEPDWKGTLFE